MNRHFSRALTGMGLALAVIVSSTTVHAGTSPTIPLQLGLVIDGSDSIPSGPPTDIYTEVFIPGVANAVSMIVPNGRVELSITQFAFEPEVVFTPRIIASQGDIDDAVAAILAMERPARTVNVAGLPSFDVSGGTNYEAALNLAADTLFSSTELGELIALNVLTDGIPTLDQTVLNFLTEVEQNPPDLTEIPTLLAIADALFAGQFASAAVLAAPLVAPETIDPVQGAFDARDAIMARGIDVLAFEAIDLQNNQDALDLLVDLAFPPTLSPVVTIPPEDFPDPFGSAGFVALVDTFSDVEGVLKQKFTAAGLIASPEPLPPAPGPAPGTAPEPATLGLVAFGIAGLGFGRWRRRRLQMQ